MSEEAKMSKSDLETDTGVTSTGTGSINRNDYTNLVRRNLQLESEIKQLKLKNERLESECEVWKGNCTNMSIELEKLEIVFQKSKEQLESKIFEEVIRSFSGLKIYAQANSSQEKKNEERDIQQGLMTQASVDGCNSSSFQPNPLHGPVSPRDTPANQASLKCSSVAYQPESAQNCHSQSTNVHTPVQSQPSKQLERLPEDQPSSPTGNQQPMTTEAGSELAIGQMEKPGVLTTSLPTQAVPSQGTTAVTTATLAAPAPAVASVPSATKSRVSRKGDRPLSKVKVIDGDMICFIKCKVIKQRKELARELGFTDAEIDTIEANIGHGDVKEVVHQIMATWRQKEGERATPDKLMKALLKIELKYQAEEFCKKFIPQNLSSESETSDEGQYQGEDIADRSRTTATPYQDQNQQGGTAVAYPTQAETPHQPQPRFHVPDTRQFFQPSRPVELSYLDDFFSEFLMGKTAKGMKYFKKDLDKNLKNFKREETNRIADEMDWDSEWKTKFDSDIKANLKVSNVLDKWALIVLSVNQYMSREDKVENLQELVRSLRGEKGGREDVIKEIRKHVVTGIIGTKVEPTTQYTDLSYGVRYKLAMELNMLDDKTGFGCSLVAEKLGIENNLIRYLTTRPEPGHQILRSWETQADATVERLYEVLMSCGAAKAAAALE